MIQYNFSSENVSLQGKESLRRGGVLQDSEIPSMATSVRLWQRPVCSSVTILVTRYHHINKEINKTHIIIKKQQLFKASSATDKFSGRRSLRSQGDDRLSPSLSKSRDWIQQEPIARRASRTLHQIHAHRVGQQSSKARQ